MKLIDYLPEMLRDIYEFQKICSAGDIELDSLRESLAETVGDNFVRSLSESGCTRWEKILKLTPKATDSMEDRRFRIHSALNRDIPYTMRGLDQQLFTLCGADGYSADLDADNYSITVKVALTAKEQFEDVRKLLAQVLPANILAKVTLKYNQHATLGAFKHEQLSKFSHDQLRNEVLA